MKGIYKTACFTNSCGMAGVGVLDSLLCGSRLKASRGSKGECFVALASCVVSGYCCAPSALGSLDWVFLVSLPPAGPWAPGPLGPGDGFPCLASKHQWFTLRSTRDGFMCVWFTHACLPLGESLRQLTAFILQWFKGGRVQCPVAERLRDALHCTAQGAAQSTAGAGEMVRRRASHRSISSC